jgi:hypothetical protein
VQSIEHLVIKIDDEEQPECANVPIGQGALLYSTQHEVLVNYAFDV